MIKRNIYNEIKDHLNGKEITLIIGPRQAGRTTIMKLLRDELNVLGSKPSMYLNLDIDDDRPFFE